MEKKLPLSIYQIALRTFTPGGTLLDAAKMLPHLKDLGCDIVYLCPFYTEDEDMDRATWSPRQLASKTDNPKNPYKIADYFHVDEEFGEDADLKTFVDAAHALGLRVMLDLVYLHCSKNAAFVAEHPNYVLREADGSATVGAEWPFARLNYADPDAREYLWSNMLHYVVHYGVDAYRCDVGDEVPLDFWAEGVRRIRAIRPDFFMLNEGFRPEYIEEVFDTNYCYSGEQIQLMTGEQSVPAFAEKMRENYAQQQHKLARMLENHDNASDCYENRMEKRLGSNVMEALLALNFTLDGVPFLWNGVEVCDVSYQNMFANRFHGHNSIHWGTGLVEQGRQRMSLIRAFHALRREHPDLLCAPTSWLDAQEGILHFTRALVKGTLHCVFNTTSAPIALPRTAECLISRRATAQNDALLLDDHGFCLYWEV